MAGSAAAFCGGRNLCQNSKVRLDGQDPQDALVNARLGQRAVLHGRKHAV